MSAALLERPKKKRRYVDGYNADRDFAGCIVTMRHRSSGETVSRWEHGLAKDALPAALSWFDPGQWYLATFSSPRTIAADLRKQRSLGHEHTSYDGNPRTRHFHSTPECTMLARIGRMDFSLLGRAIKPEKNRARRRPRKKPSDPRPIFI